MNTGYIEYARDVVDGNILACEYVVLTCKRFLSDLSNPDLVFKEEKIKMFIKFASVLKHIKGEFGGQHVHFEPWQMVIVASIFGFYRRDTGRRKYQSSYIEVPRKSGKSFLAAVMCLFALICDGEPGAEVLIAANSAKQAFEVDFETVSKLAKQLDPKCKKMRHYRDSIRIDSTSSKLIVLAADSSRMDGFNCSFGLIDEYHEAPDSKVADVIRSSMGMRKNPHLCTITTAGFNKNGPCYELRSYGIDVLKGLKEDDSLFVMIYTLDQGDDWTDDIVWKKAVPNLGITTKIEFLRDTVNRAKQHPSDEVEAKTKQFDVWCDSSSVWIPEEVIKRNMIDIDLSEFKCKNNYLVYLGFDLASVSDLTALTIMFVDPDTEEYFFKNWYYLPKSALEGKFNAELYKMWASKGYLTLTDSPTTDYNYIQGQIIYLYENFDVQGVYYDSWNAQQMVNNLINEGLPMSAYSQSIGNFNRPTREIERLLLSDRVKLDRNPITRWCFDNVELRVDINSNAKPMGDHQARKIDGVISILNSLGGYLSTVYGVQQPFVIPNSAVS